MKLKRDKRGAMGIILLFILLLTILIVGFMATIIISIVDYASGEITPVMEGLGMVGDTNMSEASEYTFGTVDTIINAFPWLLVFGYVAFLIFSIIFVMSYKYNPNPIFIGFYVVMVLLVIFGSVILSNMYQDIYDGDNIVATGLQSQGAMSHLIIHSPWIFTVLAFIVGIYLFAGKQTEFQGGWD